MAQDQNSAVGTAKKSFIKGISGTVGIIGGLLLCCLVVAVMVAMSQGSKTPTNDSSSNSSNTSSNTPKHDPVNLTFTGKGNKDTDSFTLYDGTAKMTVITTGGSVGTYSSVTLQKEGENTFLNGLTGEDLNISTDGSEDGHGDTTIRGIKEGKYYINVISGVSWTVTITQE